MKKHIVSILIILFLLIPQIQPLLSDGYFPMHDDTQVARVVAMGKALRNGQFPVRWVQDLGYGYGYPIFNFYGPLPYYAGGLSYALGLSGLESTKIMMLLGVILSALFLYAAVAFVAGPAIGVLGAIAYNYMSYHAVQLYVRGAVGEYWATVFLPLLLLGIWCIIKHRTKKGIIITGLGLCGVILSHTLLGFVTTFFFVGVLVLWFLYSFIRKQSYVRFRAAILGLIVGLGLSAFFWLPALTEMNATFVRGQVSESAQYTDHFLCLSQYIYSSWGFGGSQSGCIDGMSFALGNVYVLLLAVSLVTFFLTKLYKSRFYISGAIIFIVSILFSLSYTQIVWDSIPGLAYLQYPWRMLTFTMLGLAVIVSLAYMNIPSRLKYVFVSLAIFLIIWQQHTLFYPQSLYRQSDQSFETQEELRFRASKVSDEYLPESFVRPASIEQISRGVFPEGAFYERKMVIDKETYKKFEVIAQSEQRITLNIADFPGWKYIVNGQVQQNIIEQGRPVIYVPKDFSTVELRFEDTISRRIGNVISLIFVVILVYIYGKKTIT